MPKVSYRRLRRFRRPLNSNFEALTTEAAICLPPIIKLTSRFSLFWLARFLELLGAEKQVPHQVARQNRPVRVICSTTGQFKISQSRISNWEGRSAERDFTICRPSAGTVDFRVRSKAAVAGRLMAQPV